MSTDKKHPILSNQVYDVLKFCIQIVLPGIGALYLALVQVWNLPHSPGVNGTINAVILFLGLLLGYSSRQYNHSDDKYDGDMEVEKDGEKTVFSLSFNEEPIDLETKEQVVFRVKNG